MIKAVANSSKTGIYEKAHRFKTNDPNYQWLYDYSNNITKQAIKDACKAYKDFLKEKQKAKIQKQKRSKPSFYQDTEKSNLVIRICISKSRMGTSIRTRKNSNEYKVLQPSYHV